MITFLLMLHCICTRSSFGAPDSSFFFRPIWVAFVFPQHVVLPISCIWATEHLHCCICTVNLAHHLDHHSCAGCSNYYLDVICHHLHPYISHLLIKLHLIDFIYDDFIFLKLYSLSEYLEYKWKAKLMKSEYIVEYYGRSISLFLANF